MGCSRGQHLVHVAFNGVVERGPPHVPELVIFDANGGNQCTEPCICIVWAAGPSIRLALEQHVLRLRRAKQGLQRGLLQL